MTQTCELSAALCVLTFALRRLESMQALVAEALQASSDLIPVGTQPISSLCRVVELPASRKRLIAGQTVVCHALF